MNCRYLVVLVGLVACKKAPSPGDCARVVDKTVEQQMKTGMREGAETNGSITPEIQAEIDRLHKDMAVTLKPVKDALTKACTDDAWSADAIACLDAATTPAAFSACDAKLTATQRAHIETVTKDAMAKAAPAGSPPACTRYADLEIRCGSAKDSDRPVILDFCTKARAGAKGTTYQLIALESRCAETAADCDAYKQCVEKSKAETTPEP